MSTYTHPQFSDPDDVAPVGTPDPRHRSTYREPVVMSFRDKMDTSMAHDDPLRFDGSIRRVLIDDTPVYRPSLTVYAYVAVVVTLIACAVLWLCAGRPALTGWQL